MPDDDDLDNNHNTETYGGFWYGVLCATIFWSLILYLK